MTRATTRRKLQDRRACLPLARGEPELGETRAGDGINQRCETEPDEDPFRE